ncbi:hypothetical protein B7463_g10315, partial [Scytalidium lignicola]
MALQVQGKSAIVTGAGSGINLSFASLLLSKGCNVLIADLALRNEAEKLVSEYSGSDSLKARAVFQKTDVREWRELDRMFERAVKEFGGVDIVCPGAGVYEPPFSNFWNPPGSSTSVDNISGSRFATLDINITHPIRVTQLSIDHFMKSRKPGCVVHISSVAGQIPAFPTPLYVASKFAISGFVRSLAQLEFPPLATGSQPQLPKIRVVGVAPGLIKTPLWTEHPEKLKAFGKHSETDPEWVTPEAVAEVMLELVEKEEHVGGTILEIARGVRKVEVFGDPGPVLSGNFVPASSSASLVEDVWKSLTEQTNVEKKTQEKEGSGQYHMTVPEVIVLDTEDASTVHVPVYLALFLGILNEIYGTCQNVSVRIYSTGAGFCTVESRYIVLGSCVKTSLHSGQQLTRAVAKFLAAFGPVVTREGRGVVGTSQSALVEMEGGERPSCDFLAQG